MANRPRPNISLSSPEAAEMFRQAQRRVQERREQALSSQPPRTREEILREMSQDFEERERARRAAEPPAIINEEVYRRRLLEEERERRENEVGRRLLEEARERLRIQLVQARALERVELEREQEDHERSLTHALQRRFASNLAPGTQAIDDKTLEGKDVEIDENPEVSVEMLRCSVCLINVKDIRLTCGHMLCKNCATQVRSLSQNCPICRKPITSMDKVYYNKYLKYKNKYLQLKTKSF
jgi:hypothetical protein